MCRIWVCGNTRGSSRKGGQGPLSEVRWRGGFAASSQWGNMTWGLLPAPIGSHVTEESHLHINHLLYCSFLPLLHLGPLAQYAVSPEWDKNKSHVYCLAVSQSLSPPPSSRFVLMHFAVKVIRSQRSIPNVLFFVIKALPLEKRSPSPLWGFCLFLYEPVTGPSVHFLLQQI